MAAVLACGRDALLSHGSAAALMGIDDRERAISISVPQERSPRPPGVKVHRVVLEDGDATTRDRIPVTSPARTLVDLAIDLSPARLERAVNRADKLGLIRPDELRAELSSRQGQRGVPALRDLLDRETFALTESELERCFLRLARQAGLAKPETGVSLNGYVVDFYWRDLGLIVETDGLRYHRTAFQQARDRRRDQAHAAAGLTTLRFTHRQVVHEAPSVKRTISTVALKLTARSA
jgi:very-short-patch-repair endonuclease